MIEPVERILHGFDGECCRRLRPAQHDYTDTQFTRRGNLAVRGTAAAVLCDHDLDAMLFHQRTVVGVTEWTASGHVSHLRQRQRRIDRIDAADQIKVLRGVVERRKLVAPKCNKNPARRCSERAHGLTYVAYFGPSVVSSCDPRWSPQHQQRNAGAAGRLDGTIGYHTGVRVSGIDQKINALGRQKVGEPRSTAETAATHRHRLARRRGSAAGERQGHIEVAPACQPLRQQSRFRGAAENEDAFHAAA